MTDPSPTPEPPPPSPPGDPAPAPPPGGGAPTPPETPPPTPPESPAPPDSGTGDSWTTDRSSDSGSQGTAAPSYGAGTDNQSGAVLATPGTHPSSSSGNARDRLAIAPSVDDFDSFTGAMSGGIGLLPGDSPTCGGFACGGGAHSFVASVAASAAQIQQRAARKRDASRVEGLAQAMPPSSPGGIPGRAFSMPGGTSGGGAAFLLIGMVALLGATLSMRNWTTRLELPTATWRLSAYVPPLEHPG